MIPFTLACAAFLLATPPAPAAPDTPAVRRGWEASLGHAYSSFNSGDWASWQTTTLALRRQTPVGSVAVEAIRSERFGAVAGAGAAEAYARLWKGSYGYWRAELAPRAETLPRSDLQAELFQDFPGGWELSAGARRIAPGGNPTVPEVGATAIPLYSASVARFAGPWMVRGRFSLVPFRGQTGQGGALFVRRYLGKSGEFAQLALSMGEEVVTVAAGPLVDVRETSSVALHAQKFLLGALGLSGGIEYAAFAGIPDRREVSLGVVARW